MIISVVGAGGKTTVGQKIAYELANKGFKTLFTTTTKIFRPESGSIYLGPAQDINANSYLTTAAKSELENAKLGGYSADEIKIIASKQLFDYIIVEADGAKQRTVKCPNDTEPVYPHHTDLIIGVIGLACLGKPISNEFVHRKELFAAVTQAHVDDVITAYHILSLIHHPDGLFRHAPKAAKKIVFLNKYDTIDKGRQYEVDMIVKESKPPVLVTARDRDWFSDFYAEYIGWDHNES